MRMRRTLCVVFATILCGFCAAPAAHAAKRKTVTGELQRLYASGAVAQADYAADRAAYSNARARVKRLSGARRLELGGVLRALDDMAARGQFSASRLPALFLTPQRNVDYWTARPLIANGTRVSFPDDLLVWQLYAGHGLQIQWLGTFGSLNALGKSKRNNAKTDELLSEALSLGSARAGGLAWEYL